MEQDLLQQLQALIGGAEKSQAQAEQWRRLVDLLAGKGYGAAITPEQVAHLVPDGNRVADVMAESRPKPAGKRGRKAKEPSGEAPDGA